MPLARALALASLTLAILLGPVQAGSDPPSILVPSEEVQARGIRVLAALLVALSASGPQGVTAPSARVAEAERLLSSKLIEDRIARSPAPPLRLRRIAEGSRDAHADTAPNASFYNIFHTFAAPVTIMSSPITDAFAAPCDSWKIGWPRAEATEMLRDECTGLVPRGERLKLSDGLHRRRLDSIPDVILGQNAPPSLFRMNLDGISRTHLPALFIANW